MPTLGLNISLLVASAAQVYGVQATPPFAQHDRMSDIAGNPAYSLSGLRIVPEAGILILEPQALLEPTLTTGWTFPDGLTWMQATDSATGLYSLYQPVATADTSFTAVSNAAQPANAAFYVRVGRGQPAPTATLDADHVYTTLTVGDSTTPSVAQGATPFRLVLEYGRPPFLQQAIADPGGSDSWVWSDFGVNGVVSTTIARSEDLFDDTSRVVNIEWLPVPSSNVLMVRLANGRDTLVFRPQQPTPVYGNGLTYNPPTPLSVCAGTITVAGSNGVASIQYLPMRFATSGTLTSPNIALPFTLPSVWSVRTPNAEVDPFTQTIDGEIDALDGSGQVICYVLTLTSTADSSGLAPLSPIVREVQIDIPATYYAVGGSAPLDLSSHVAEVEEHQWFDPDTLTVHSEVGINFDNTPGTFPLFGSSHVAAQYARGLIVDDNYGALYSAVTGWAGYQTTLSRADPSRRFDMVIADKSWQLRRSPVGALPFLDGWCFLAAIHFLANVAGVTDSFLGEPITDCAFGANPAGCPHAKLSQVPGQSSKLRFPVEYDVWRAMTEIVGFVDWVLGFDTGGVLRAAEQTSLLTATPIRGTFGTVDIADTADPNYLLTIRDKLSVTLDTSQRRTGIAFYGVGPQGQPTVAAVMSVDDTMPFFVRDVHGFRQPKVENTNLLDDQSFAAMAAGTNLARLILPQYTVEFGSYYLPALFPLDQCFVDDPITLGSPTRINVTEVSQTWAAADPSRFHSRIKGRVQ